MIVKRFINFHFGQLACGLGVLVIIVALIFAGCDSNSTDAGDQELEVVGIEVTPENHTIIKGEDKKFTGLIVTSTGDRIPFDELDRNVWGWTWFTTDSQIATFDNTGLATGHNVGDTICWVVLFHSNAETGRAHLLKEKISLNAEGSSEEPQIQRLSFTGRDFFGVQVIAPDEVKAKFNLQ